MTTAVTGKGSTTSLSGRIRPLIEEDLSQVVALHTQVFRSSARLSSDALRSYLLDIFFRHPWYDEALPSLMYEDGEGRMLGCLGVMPRRMTFLGKPVRAAISHNFMVEPGSRSTLAGVHLLKRFFAGAQDLSLAEGNALARKLWEGLGGRTSLVQGFRWIRPLRPGGYLLSILKERGLPAPLGWVLGPLADTADALATRMAVSPFRRVVPRVSGEDLDERTFVAHVRDVSRGRAVAPEYDERSVSWLFEILRRRKGHGTFRAVVVRDAQRTIVGWYLYYLNSGGVSDVVQVAARPHAAGDVLDHLFDDAGRRGALAVSGQVDPNSVSLYADRHCVFYPGESWMLTHSPRTDVLQAIDHGDAFLTRLEGEWWIGLQGGWVEPAPGRAAPDRTTSIPDDPRRSGEDRASAGALVVTQYDRTEDFEGLRKEWNDLLERSRSQSVFLTWEWLYAWWRHFGAGFDLRIVAVRREGRLVGIGPFCVSPTWRWMPLRVLTFLGTTRVSSEYLDIVADPSCEQEVVDAIFRTFREDGGRWDCMVLPEVLAESLVLSHLEGRARSAGSRVQRTLSQVCPYLNLPKSDVEFFALLGPQMRAALRRSTRKLEGVGAEVKRIDLVDGDPSVLSVLFSLHEKRWAVRNRAGNFKDQTIRAFHGQLVKDLGAAGWLCLYVLQMEGRPIGVLYGFRFKDKFFFYQSGFDPQPPTSAIKWADYSPGLVLIGHGIREAIVQGLTEFDYLRGVEPYKRRWTKTDRTTWCLTVVPTGNWKARLLLRIQDTVTQTKTIVRAAVGKRKRDSAGSMKGKSV